MQGSEAVDLRIKEHRIGKSPLNFAQVLAAAEAAEARARLAAMADKIADPAWRPPVMPHSQRFARNRTTAVGGGLTRTSPASPSRSTRSPGRAQE